MDPYWLHLHRLRKDEARKQFRNYLDQYGKNTKYITNNQDGDFQTADPYQKVLNTNNKGGNLKILKHVPRNPKD